MSMMSSAAALCGNGATMLFIRDRLLMEKKSTFGGHKIQSVFRRYFYCMENLPTDRNKSGGFVSFLERDVDF